MNSHNQRSCRSKKQGYGSNHLHSVNGGPNQELDSHCIRPISSQRGWETDVVGFVVCDGDVRHCPTSQLDFCGPGDSSRAGRAASSDRISPLGGWAQQKLQWSRTLVSGPGEPGGGTGSSPPIVPDRKITLLVQGFCTPKLSRLNQHRSMLTFVFVWQVIA